MTIYVLHPWTKSLISPMIYQTHYIMVFHTFGPYNFNSLSSDSFCFGEGSIKKVQQISGNNSFSMGNCFLFSLANKNLVKPLIQHLSGQTRDVCLPVQQLRLSQSSRGLTSQNGDFLIISLTRRN